MVELTVAITVVSACTKSAMQSTLITSNPALQPISFATRLNSFVTPHSRYQVLHSHIKPTLPICAPYCKPSRGLAHSLNRTICETESCVAKLPPTSHYAGAARHQRNSRYQVLHSHIKPTLPICAPYCKPLPGLGHSLNRTICESESCEAKLPPTSHYAGAARPQ